MTQSDASNCTRKISVAENVVGHELQLKRDRGHQLQSEGDRGMIIKVKPILMKEMVLRQCK